MNRHITTGFITIALLLTGRNGSCQNLIQNAGFETATTGVPLGTPLPAYPTLLNFWSAVNTDGEFIREPLLAHTGTGFLSVLQNSGANPINWWLGAASSFGGYDRAVQIVPVAPSTDYRLQLWMRSGEQLRYGGYGAGKALLQVEQFQPTPLKIDSLTAMATATWQQLTLDFKTGPSCTSIAVLMSCFGPGGVDVWWDDLDLHTIAICAIASHFKSSDTTFCEEAGKCLDFTDLSTCNPTSWQWLFPGASPNNSNQQNPTNICYTNPGTYAVTLIVSNGAGSDTLTVSPMIILGTAPVAPILTVSHDTIFCSSAFSYQWYRNGFVIAGATDSFYVFTQNGTYAVQITDGIGCSRLSDGVVIIGVQSSEFKVQSIRVYPNPAGDELLVEGMGRDAVVSVYSTLGEEMLTARYNVKAALNIKSLSAGIYFIRVVGEKGNWVGRFVKE